jgi:hypothetical protein
MRFQAAHRFGGEKAGSEESRLEQLPMKFSIQHQRATVGNDVTVGAEADGEEQISRVTITLDGFDIGDEPIDPPSVSYERQFVQVGDASPHRPHHLTVTITDPQGSTKSADRRWEDVS